MQLLGTGQGSHIKKKKKRVREERNHYYYFFFLFKCYLQGGNSVEIAKKERKRLFLRLIHKACSDLTKRRLESF